MLVLEEVELALGQEQLEQASHVRADPHKVANVELVLEVGDCT